MIREAVEAHARACREALREGRERPRWGGGPLGNGRAPLKRERLGAYRGTPSLCCANLYRPR